MTVSLIEAFLLFDSWPQNGVKMDEKIAAFMRSLVTDFLVIILPSNPGHVIPGNARGWQFGETSMGQLGCIWCLKAAAG